MAQRRGGRPPPGTPPLEADDVQTVRSISKARAPALPKQPLPQAYQSAAGGKPAEYDDEDFGKHGELSISTRGGEQGFGQPISPRQMRQDSFDDVESTAVQATSSARESPRPSIYESDRGESEQSPVTSPVPPQSRKYDPALAARPENYDLRHLLSVSQRWLKDFVTTSPESGLMVRCFIQRLKSGMFSSSTLYTLCADLGDGSGRELIYCSRYQRSTGVYYTFSMNRDDLARARHQRSQGYLGKLRSLDNASFVLYDSGETLQSFDEAGEGDDEEEHEDVPPASAENDQKEPSPTKRSSLGRQELAVIVYHGSERFLERRCEVCLPTNQDRFKSKMSLARSMHQIMVQRQQNVLYSRRTFVLHEKKSLYDPLSSCLVDFRGRASMASTKNCQFIQSWPEGQKNADGTDETEHAPVLLQMGKATKDCFNLDYQCPLTMLQAFAVAITRFDFPVEY